MSSDYFFKRFKSNPILSALIIGIIGSALWEKAISPFSDYMFDKFLDIGGIFVTALSNNIYREVSYGVPGKFSMTMNAMIIGALIGLCLSLISQTRRNYISSLAEPLPTSLKEEKYPHHPIETERNISSIEHSIIELKNNFEHYQQQATENRQRISELKANKTSSLKGTYLKSLALGVPFVIFCIFNLIQYSYIDNTIMKLTSNIEIVSPYITDAEYKSLKSDFHAMSSRTDYNALVNSLNLISSSFGIDLK